MFDFFGLFKNKKDEHSSIFLDPFKTRKGKKQWVNLPDDSKKQVINAAIQEKYGKVMAREIAKSIITGGEIELENIYNRFVVPIDQLETSSVEWAGQVDVLLSYIRVKHLNYIAKQVRHNELDGGNKNEK